MEGIRRYGGRAAAPAQGAGAGERAFEASGGRSGAGQRDVERTLLSLVVVSEHIVRTAKGGEDDIENTLVLCRNCHRRMHLLDQEANKTIHREMDGR